MPPIISLVINLYSLNFLPLVIFPHLPQLMVAKPTPKGLVLPSLPHCQMIYSIPSMSQFNLLSIGHLSCSLDCIISFPKVSVFLGEWSSSHMIGIGCESDDFYQLSSHTCICTIIISSLLTCALLGHPSLTKVQRLLLSLYLLYLRSHANMGNILVVRS